MKMKIEVMRGAEALEAAGRARAREEQAAAKHVKRAFARGAITRDRLVTIEEACAIGRFSAYKFRKLRKEGKIKPAGISSRLGFKFYVRFSSYDVEMLRYDIDNPSTAHL